MIGKNFSHYKILEKLGEGGMGEVYLAEDIELERQVALKFLPSHMSSDKDAIQRFKREAKAAAALNHPNIVTIYEVSKYEEQIFIAMEYVDGESLRERITKGPLSVDEVVEYAIQICEGLEKAHNAGIVHRDIKPENILVDTDGRVKVLDFGLAKLKGVSRITKEKSTFGTINYMSPEQIRGEEVDHRTDIWSFGIVLFEMLTNQTPFRGDYEAVVIYSILNERIPSIETIRKDIPNNVKEIVTATLEKNPVLRYQSMRELQEELKRPVTSSILQRPKGSIAVLPFSNMSADPEQDYFCDGMAEEIINALTQLEDLYVVARTSAFSFRGKEIDVREIGKTLNVEHVLEGSVRKAGNRLRITAQLIKVANGYHLWSERFDREMEDIFDIQDEISRAIVEKLKVQLLGDEKIKLVKRYTENVEAYSLYLKGRYFWNRRTENDLKRANEYFCEAIKIDPNYALAYSGQADVYNMLGSYMLLPPKEAYPKSKELAQKALAIDNSLAEAYASLALVKYNFFWDFADTEKDFKKAIELNSSYATVHSWYGDLLVSLGRFEDALAEAEIARKLDPISSPINAIVGWTYYMSRQYDQAIKQCQRALEINPNFHDLHNVLACSYLQKSLFIDAINGFQKAVTLSGESVEYIPQLAYAYTISGKKGEALKILDTLLEQSKRRYIPAYLIAMIYAGLNEVDQAFEWFEKAYEERSFMMVFLKVEPRFDSLRSDSRFSTLVKKVGL